MQDPVKQALATLITDIGNSAAIAFVQFALPHLVERRNTLLVLLEQAQWLDAALLAHKIINSVRFYDDGSLEALLRRILQRNITEHELPEFRQTLQQQFDITLTALQAWLEKNH